jgi:hypothetical protein
MRQDEPVDLVIVDEPARQHEEYRRWLRFRRHPEHPQFGMVGAFGVTSLSLGIASVLTALIFSFCLPWLSLPFASLGITFAGLAIYFSISNHRHGPGLGMAIFGLITSLLSLAITIGIWFTLPDQLKKLESKLPSNQDAAELVGIWKRADSDEIRLQFTNRGNVIVTTTRSDRSYEEMGKYRVLGGALLLTDNRGLHDSRHPFEIINDNELVIGDSSSSSAFFSTRGRWNRMTPLTPDANSTSNSHSVDLRDLERSRERVEKALTKYRADKQQVLVDIQQLESAEKLDEDLWNLNARELKTLVDQIRFLTLRQEKLNQAIARLETVTRFESRKAELASLGISEEELQQLSVTIYELDDELNEIARVDVAAETELKLLVDEEIQKTNQVGVRPESDTDNSKD